MSKQPITDNIFSDEELKKLAKHQKVGQYFIPTVSNASNSPSEAHYTFKTINKALYLNMAGDNYRVIDVKLSEPKLIKNASGTVASRDIVVKYAKNHNDEVASGELGKCKAPEAEKMVKDIAKRGIRTNLTLENKSLQKPLTNAPSDAIFSKNALKVPQKVDVPKIDPDAKPDEKRSLWHGLFKKIAPNLLQTGCLVTLMACIYGILMSPFMPFIVLGCVLGMIFPGNVVDLLEKAVQHTIRAVKVVYFNYKYAKDCRKYNRQSKDFWGAIEGSPRKERKAQKENKKQFFEEQKQREMRIKEANKLSRKGALKGILLSKKYSNKTSPQQNRATSSDYTLGM